MLFAARSFPAQQPADEGPIHIDSDGDGLSDALEQRLLNQFAPKFMVAANDCSTAPAEFYPGMPTPQVKADNGTIYGQVFPVKQASDHAVLAEIHYYHLWRKDCGSHGHPLDTEHVAVMVRAANGDAASRDWKAVYWYAAAHQDTVCDVSQIASAATLGAEDHGPAVWVSPGKHASYLNEALCRGGCGADRCENMIPLHSAAAPINLGEPNHPANGALFIASNEWPLLAKMSTTDFPAAAVVRLNQLPATDIAWFNPGRHPVQGVIAKSSVTGQAIAGGGRNTTSALLLAVNSTGGALSTAGDSSDDALSLAGHSTDNAIQRSLGNTWRALGIAAGHTGDALHISAKKKAEEPR
ncbi:MAG TPA: hypothetical protein VGJ21_08175 [Terracidiphilus sp.]|jgi:hypothetical protein